jgi:hypothetical protein
MIFFVAGSLASSGGKDNVGRGAASAASVPGEGGPKRGGGKTRRWGSWLRITSHWGGGPPAFAGTLQALVASPAVIQGMTYCVAVRDVSHSAAINEKQNWHSYVECWCCKLFACAEASIGRNAQIAAEVAKEDSHDR